MKRIAVIGATGTIGSAVVSELQSRGDCEVVAVSRSSGVKADLTDPASLDAPLKNADAVFLVWVAPPDAAPAAIERIARHTRRIVLLSAPHKTPHPFFQQTNPMAAMMARLEALIESSGVEWTNIRPGMFAANSIGWWASQIQAGDVVRWPYAAAATAPIDERDVAAVAARALLDDGHAGRDYVITGPESLTQAEQVAIIGDAIGRKLVLEEISPAEAHAELPFPSFAIDMLMKAWAAAVGLPAYMTNQVAEITGREARSFREWSRDHASAFRGTHA